ncbi:MAG: hypothetical protein Greene041662_151 [Candidatus Peregrinibacteria bacterium Greene0416_62]|nr:MAG: hypothetical protein Greene041662_151 [Candidatus Peregrinibacteria bacterium Greene0416_62]
MIEIHSVKFLHDGIAEHLFDALLRCRHVFVTPCIHAAKEFFVFSFRFLLVENHILFLDLIRASEAVRTPLTITQEEAVAAIDAVAAVAQVVAIAASHTFVEKFTMLKIQIVDAGIALIDP